MVNFVGRISMYGLLNLTVSCPAHPNNLKNIYNKYLTSHVFLVRTVNYGSSFFPVDLWPTHFAIGPKINVEKLGLELTEQTSNLVYPTLLKARGCVLLVTAVKYLK